VRTRNPEGTALGELTEAAILTPAHDVRKTVLGFAAYSPILELADKALCAR
jgi:hypothetical protein